MIPMKTVSEQADCIISDVIAIHRKRTSAVKSSSCVLFSLAESGTPSPPLYLVAVGNDAIRKRAAPIGTSVMSSTEADRGSLS